MSSEEIGRVLWILDGIFRDWNWHRNYGEYYDLMGRIDDNTFNRARLLSWPSVEVPSLSYFDAFEYTTFEDLLNRESLQYDFTRAVMRVNNTVEEGRKKLTPEEVKAVVSGLVDITTRFAKRRLAGNLAETQQASSSCCVS